MNETCVAALTEDRFQAEVIEHPGAVLVDFYGTHCAPCQMLAPVLEDLCGRRPDVKVVKVNTEQNQRLAMAHGLQAVPTLVLYRDGKPVAQTRGYQGRNPLEKWLDEVLARTA